MDEITFLKRISVKINDTGSGVIVKPCTDEYCYVFTDYHVIQNIALEEISVEYYVVNKDEDGEDVWKFEKARPIALYKKEQKDVAVLVMPAEMAKDFVELQELRTGKNLYHVGFPSGRKDAECDLQWNYYHILELRETLNHGWVAYRLKESQAYKDLSGTSGGGIFTDRGCLIGLHRGSGIIESSDYYSDCTLIPVKFFERVLTDSGLEQVWPFKWDSFEPFFQKAFAITVWPFGKMLTVLATELEIIKRECINLSPKEILHQLNLYHIVNSKCFENCFQNENFGISFLEYIVCMHLIYNFPISLEGVFDMVKHSLFIYLEKPEEDIFMATKHIDASYLEGIKVGQDVYVGGLKHSDDGCDIIKRGDRRILNISRPLTNNCCNLDIADARKLQYNFISTRLFTDCLLTKKEQFDGLEAIDALALYVKILKEKICESDEI